MKSDKKTKGKGGQRGKGAETAAEAAATTKKSVAERRLVSKLLAADVTADMAAAAADAAADVDVDVDVDVEVDDETKTKTPLQPRIAWPAVRPPRVTVIGAGPAGLCAARLMRHYGVETTVLEARDRIGGRILSETFPARPEHNLPASTVDLGASFVHGGVCTS